MAEFANDTLGSAIVLAGVLGGWVNGNAFVKAKCFDCGGGEMQRVVGSADVVVKSRRIVEWDV